MTTKTNDGMPWIEAASADDMRRVVQALYRVHRLIAAITDLDSLLGRIVEEVHPEEVSLESAEAAQPAQRS